MQQNDIIILLVVAKAGVIFYALSLFSSLYSLRVFLNAERKSVVRLSRVVSFKEDNSSKGCERSLKI